MATKRLNLEVRTKGAKKAESEFKMLGGAVGKLSGLFTGVMALSLGKAALDLAKTSAEAEGVRIAFDRLNKPDLLNKLRVATRNTVNDVELMKRAVSARNFQISLEQLPILLKFAQQRARETGESVDFLVNSIVTGIGRKSALILDNLGLSAIRIREEFKKSGDMAKAVGKIIEEEFERTGELGKTTADTYGQLATVFENLFNTLGDGINKVANQSGFTQFLEYVTLRVQTMITPFKDVRSATEQYAEAVKKLTQEQRRQVENENWTTEARLKAAQAILNGTDKIKAQGKELTESQKAWNAFVVKQEEARAKAEQNAEFTRRYRIEMKLLKAEALDLNSLEIKPILAPTEADIFEFEKLKQIRESIISQGPVKLIDHEEIKIVHESSEALHGLQQMGEGLANNLSSSLHGAFVKSFQDGTSALKNFGKAFSRMLENMVAELLAKSIIFAFFQAIGIPIGDNSGSGGGGFMDFVFGGFRAGGGPAQKGKGYIVGDGGQPELFVPKEDGYIYPSIPPSITNNNMNNAQTVNITINADARDTQFIDNVVIPRIQRAVRLGAA